MLTMKKEERTTEKMRNTLKRATDKTKKKYLESICDEVMEFQGTGRYALMCLKTQELVWEENLGIQKHCNRRLAMEYNSRSETIWDNYITQHYDRANGTEILDVEPEEEVHADERGTVK